MNQLSRAAMKWSRLIETAQPNRRLPCSSSILPKLFSTEASEPSLGSSDDQFFQTPSTGLVYGRLMNITKHMTKSDVISLLEGSNLNPENLKVEYNRAYAPMSMMVEFPSRTAYDAALRAIGRKGRLFNLLRADKAQWDINAPYHGKAILMHGIPRNALSDDVERFLSGCQYDSSSIQMSVRPTNQGLVRMALVYFPSPALAMHAYITKNRGFCLNNQITVYVDIVEGAEKLVFQQMRSSECIMNNRHDSRLLLKYRNLYQTMAISFLPPSLAADRWIVTEACLYPLEIHGFGVMDNSKTHQQRRGSSTPSSMPRMLWSNDSPTRDLRSSDDHKGVNVQVVLRCRPLNEDEIKTRTPILISCDELKQEVSAAQTTAYKQIDRTFVFDKVFGPASQQKDLYDIVVSPVVNEVLEGYSWTIFAYGQTGTGKTYTMEGEGRKEKNGQFHKDAGVIPRAVQQIFDILDSGRAYYSMKVTFLELYNEEITDLLAPEEPKRSLVLLEDGKGSVFVRGLEEKIVCSADEIYAILDEGSAKKHTADTLLNKQSNRSHSVFSITIQVNESNSDGSEVTKCGKLNLVDLAGSENILRSGAREVRAREAGEINKSLLTLGRVINALAENSAHVPYRDSKLTRLLRDSLGGKMKTCIIATVSPSVLSQEETLSTLDYASRAKRIKNRPEVNKKVVHSTLIKDLYSQIDRLRQELHAARKKNDIYVPQDNQHSQEATRKQLMELQELCIYQQHLTVDLKDKLESTQRELTKTRQSLSNLENQYQQAKEMNKDKEAMISKILCSGKALTERSLELRSELEDAASDVSTLLARIEHKNDLEDRNRHNIQNFHSQLAQQLEELNKAVSDSVTRQEQNWKAIQDNTDTFLTAKSTAMDELLKQIQNLKDLYESGTKHLDDSAEEMYQNSQQALSRLSSELSTHSSCIMDLVLKSSSEAGTISNGLKTNLNNLGSRIYAFLQQEQENHFRSFHTTKSISQNLLDFFKTLRICTSKLTLMQEDSQTITNQKLRAFTKKYEEFALGEERLLLQQMAELLASSSSRKRNLIQAAVDDILESACHRNHELNQEISNVQNSTADAEEKWTNYIERIEGNHEEDSAAIESGKTTLGEGLQCCIRKSTEVFEQHRVAEESLLDVLKKNVDSVDFLIKNEKEDNEKIHARFSSVLDQETDDARKNTTLSVEYPLRLGHEATEKIRFLSARWIQEMKEMDSIHSEKVFEISRIARKSLLDDFLVDGSFCLNQKRRSFDLPSKEYFENFITDSFGHSLESSQQLDAVANQAGVDN